MDLGLNDSVALVTGASSGLGFATARALAEEGATVVLAARGADRLVEAVSSIRAAVPDAAVEARPCDVADLAAAAALVEETVARHGRLDILVANTGGVPPGPASAFGIEDYRAAFERVTLAAINLALAALPHLKASGRGRLLFVTSETIRHPTPVYALSGVARMGLLGWVKSMADELGEAGCTANIIAPGHHRTPLLEGHVSEVELAARAASIPMRRIGDPGDFGKVACFLAGAPAGFVHGTVVLVDGGLSRGI